MPAVFVRRAVIYHCSLCFNSGILLTKFRVVPDFQSKEMIPDPKFKTLQQYSNPQTPKTYERMYGTYRPYTGTYNVSEKQ